jgi:UDP-3-O-[3-hydroxymyristoyl] glucosamine N-acyltransferase
MLRTPNPYLAFAEAIALLSPATRPPAGVDPTAVVASDARVAPGASIGPLVAVGPRAIIGARTVLHPGVVVGAGARIGDDCVIHARVSVREGVELGNRVVVQDGAVIGSDGFGFAQRSDGTHQKIPQIGAVVIEDDVEVGANTTIDRPAVGETRIKAGTKIDNLVQVAHGVHVGRDVLLAAQVGIAGSSTLGDRVALGGQVGVAGHITLGDGVRATAQTGIPNDVEAGTLVSGYPAISNREWLKASAVFRRLPDLKRTLTELERRVAELEAAASGTDRRR